MLGIREKVIYCGENYKEVDIYPHNPPVRKKGTRSKKKKESLLSQKNLNNKNAKRKLNQLIETNFSNEDYFLTLTYNDKFLPSNLKDAEKELRNFIRRLKRRYKKADINLKYVYVTAFTEKNNNDLQNDNDEIEIVRVHHHLVISGGLDRDEIEETWKKKNDSMGYANTKKLQPDINKGLSDLVGYMINQPSNRRRWNCSQNLERPVSRTNDYKYTRRKIRSIVGYKKDLSYWEEQYPGFYIADKEQGYEEVYNELTGWSIYLKLRKKE
ncbi:hypothetical protein ACKA04_04610 [Helcococcus kunzii]|uniref:rolling circle replication-associated protein n=1 Tax=Helcococcus kunzii TaxID=40091 RepID=UPI00389BACEC